MSRIVLLNPKLIPMTISAIFKQKKAFSFSKFLGRFDEKRAAATPVIDQFAKIWSEHVLRIKTESLDIIERGFSLAAVNLLIWASEWVMSTFCLKKGKLGKTRTRLFTGEIVKWGFWCKLPLFDHFCCAPMQ